MFMLNPSSMALFGVHTLSLKFYLLLLAQLVTFCISISILGWVAGRLLRLAGATLKRSFLVTISYIAIYFLINLAFILFPETLRSNRILDLINIVIMLFVMSYLYAYFFRSSYMEGLSITLITIVLFIFVALLLYFIFIGILLL